MRCRKLCQLRMTPYYIFVCGSLLLLIFKGTYLRYTLSMNNVKAEVWGNQTKASADQKKNQLKPTDAVNVSNSPTLEYTPGRCVGKQTKDDPLFKEVLPDVFVYSAFLDVRDIANKPRDRIGVYTIRIMAALPTLTGKVTYYCVGLSASRQFWSTQVSVYKIHERYNDGYDMFILSCRLPFELGYTPPCSVLISPTRAPTNTPQWIKVNPPESGLRHKVEICVPPLFGAISNIRMIEFIEMSRLFGVEHIHFYNYKASVSILQVLSYYEKSGFVSVLPWQLDRRLENGHLHYHGQTLCVQDCLYRSMFTSHFLAFMDFDEMFVPRQHSDWFAMMTSLHNQAQLAGVMANSAFFDPRWGDSDNRNNKQRPQLRMARNAIRTKTLNTQRTKCIVNPRHVFEMGIHKMNMPIAETMRLERLPGDILLLHHYRYCQFKSPPGPCNERVTDNTLLPYASQLETNVKRVLVSLEL